MPNTTSHAVQKDRIHYPPQPTYQRLVKTKTTRPPPSPTPHIRPNPILRVTNGGISFTLPVNKSTDNDLINETIALQTRKKVRFQSPELPEWNASATAQAYPTRQPLPIYNGLEALEAASDISMNLLLESVAPNTRKSYKTGMNHHTKFVNIMGTNIDLSMSPTGWEMFSLDHPQYRNFKVAYWCAFIIYLDRNVKVIPKTISQYLTGAAWFLQNQYYIDTTFTKSYLVRNTMKGITNIWRAQTGNKESDRRRLGVPLDLIMALARRLEEHKTTEHYCALTFYLFAFQLLARKSELIYFKDNQHYLKVENVNFTFTKTHDPLQTEFSVTCCDVATYRDKNLFDLRSVQIEIKDAKNDQQGSSHRYSFDKRPESFDTTKTFCIAHVAFMWALRSKPVNKKHAFLSYPLVGSANKNARTYPSEEMLRKLLKEEASRHGLDPRRVTLHSIRIGAATTLAAKGAPDVFIKNAGRWLSDCYQRYIHDIVHMNAKISEFLANADHYTIDDVKKWCVAHDITQDKDLDEDD